MSAHPTPQTGVRELTIRGVIIGGLITLLFTAANVYLGLKVGLTFATSIPAAVISMAILRYFRDHTVIENNIVQTIASAAGTLSAIIFVLPGLVMIGWWAGFPYWQTVLVTALGGILGVMYSIPLRRALVTGSDLPFPEGVAAAEVLKVGDSSEGAEENRRGLLVIIGGALAAAGFSLLSAGAGLPDRCRWQRGQRQPLNGPHRGRAPGGDHRRDCDDRRPADLVRGAAADPYRRAAAGRRDYLRSLEDLQYGRPVRWLRSGPSPRSPSRSPGASRRPWSRLGPVARARSRWQNETCRCGSWAG